MNILPEHLHTLIVMQMTLSTLWTVESPSLINEYEKKGLLSKLFLKHLE
jgi:hypothetical protein